jgi:hypothetical protein
VHTNILVHTELSCGACELCLQEGTAVVAELILESTENKFLFCDIQSCLQKTRHYKLGPHLRSRMTARRATVSSGRTQCVISSAANPLEQEKHPVISNRKHRYSQSHHQDKCHTLVPMKTQTDQGPGTCALTWELWHSLWTVAGTELAWILGLAWSWTYSRNSTHCHSWTRRRQLACTFKINYLG